MRCFIHVSDPADPRLSDYVRLTDAELRKSLEAEHGLFVAEGEKVIRRAAAAGYRVRSLLATEQRAASLADLAAACGGPAYVVPAPVAEQLTGYHVHRGALAAMDRRPLPPVAGVLAGVRTALILEDIVDHTNVGAIFRCAAALGVGAVIVSPRCADPLYRRSVKVSMGAVFAVPWARMDDWHGGLDTVRAAGFRLLALTPDSDAVPMIPAAPGPTAPEPTADEAGTAGAGGAPGETAQLTASPGERTALLLGTEGDGLSSRWRRVADQSVRIPMDPGARAAGVDSLNVVAAAAIACQWLVTATSPVRPAAR
ncbi:MAG TPA: RNA methyltransferase [Streptosporangiaceae bacterium]|nr:RNA methyltransferase [Streptosporangiaceae bacterium]